VKSVGPDVFVTYNWGAIEWAPGSWTLPIAHIHVEDGFGPDEASRQLRRRVWFRRLALAKSYAVVVPSRTLLSIARDTWKLPAGQVCYIPNGIEAAAYQASGEAGTAMRREIDLPSAAQVIGWVGGIRREKNVGRLLRAFAHTSSDAILVIVGDGPERGAIESEIQTLRIANRVRLMGVRTDIQRLMPAFDVLALSSDTEQMPMVVLEGMAAGLSVASVDVGDVRTMVSPENRRFIVEQSDTALAGALSDLLASSELRRSIGSANRLHVAQHFPIDRMISSYLELFESAARIHPLSKRGVQSSRDSRRLDN
jgi:glycosyltransferase involved in cell wall biosynthesis